MPRHELTLRLVAATDSAWLGCVLEDFDSFLKDHASCEKKASGMALSIASHYPDQPLLLNAMADLAVEELTHYRDVVRLLTRRGSQPGPDRKDTYINALNQAIRKEPHYLLDRLLVAAIVERRGHERFGLIAEALAQGPEQQFFRSITASEARHFELFLHLAEDTHPQCDIQQRLDVLCAREGEILRGGDIRATLH